MPIISEGLRRYHEFTTEEAWLARRAEDLTSSDIAALFNVSPYLTKYDLWHRKAQKLIPPFEVTERVKWGNRLEATIAKGIAKDQGWTVRPMKEYINVPSLSIGSSFDYAVVDDVGAIEAILEIKAVDWLESKNKWLYHEDGTVEAPLHIELQLQHQMLVSGVSKGYIGVLIGGNQVQLLERDAIPDYQDVILERAAQFWASVDANQPPTPDFPDDLEVIQRIYPFGDPCKAKDVTGDADFRELCEEYAAASRIEKDAIAMKDTAKAKLLMASGDHSKVTCGQWTVSSGMVGETDISYTRKAYRNFRVTQRKSKP